MIKKFFNASGIIFIILMLFGLVGIAFIFTHPSEELTYSKTIAVKYNDPNIVVLENGKPKLDNTVILQEKGHKNPNFATLFSTSLGILSLALAIAGIRSLSLKNKRYLTTEELQTKEALIKDIKTESKKLDNVKAKIKKLESDIVIKESTIKKLEKRIESLQKQKEK